MWRLIAAMLSVVATRARKRPGTLHFGVSTHFPSTSLQLNSLGSHLRFFAIDSRRGRVFLRIGIGEASWIGSFEIGHMNVSTIAMMPDDKHLFVSAEGAGYIIDLKSRTLVEQIGTDVAGVMVDEPRTVFIVDHNGMSLEGFGRTGRLWKTDTISSGGFRETALEDNSIAGEARQAPPEGGSVFL
ncbi:MAG TPA: hypothetical protein VF713_03855 [Thermoanaerobaculia bacterium]